MAGRGLSYVKAVCVCRGGHRGQQTLFDCVKRKKQSFDDGDDSPGVGPSTTQGQTQQQGNFVTVQNPSGHSTIIINADAFSGTSATCTKQGSLSHPVPWQLSNSSYATGNHVPKY